MPTIINESIGEGAMSESQGGGELILECPICTARFPVTLEGRGPDSAHVKCTGCGHTLTTDEMLLAMAASLNEMLDKARDRLGGGS